MFDDLHDPDPPAAGLDALASVTRRAQHLRRRRQAILAGSVLGVLALIGAGVLVNQEDNGGDGVSVDNPPIVTEPAPSTTGTPGASTTTTTTLAPATTTTALGTTTSSPSVDPGAATTTAAPDATATTTTTVATGIDCAGGTETYLGNGMVAVVPAGATVASGPGTDDPGPIHAQASADVTVGDAVARVGRAAPAVGSTSASATVNVGVVSESDELRECLEATAYYDRTLDLLREDGDADDAWHLGSQPLVAVDDSGDAVIVPIGGDIDPTLLYDGTDPDDPDPVEGDSVVVDTVDISHDGQTAWIGLCCEPVAGNTLKATPPVPATYDDSIGFGHAPTLSPGGDRLAVISYDGIVVTGVNADPITIPMPVDSGYVSDLRWTGADTLAVLSVSETTTDVIAYQVQDEYLVDGTPTDDEGHEVVPKVLAETGRITFEQAGWNEAALYDLSIAGFARGPISRGDPMSWSVHAMYLFGVDEAGTLLAAYDPVTLARIYGDKEVPAGTTFASVSPTGSRLWIDGDRTLFAEGNPLDGSYLWAR